MESLHSANNDWAKNQNPNEESFKIQLCGDEI